MLKVDFFINFVTNPDDITLKVRNVFVFYFRDSI